MPQRVIDAIVDHTVLEAKIGGYEAEAAAAERFAKVYKSAAMLLGASPHEIALIENATRAWDMAFYSIEFKQGDRILTSMAEYASNVIAFLHVKDRGVSVEVVPNDEHGQLSVPALESMLDSRVRLIAVSHMPTNGGLVQPAAEIGKLASQNGSLFLLDACQTAGQIPLDVEKIRCDFLSATSRKYLRGPRGAGFLYVRSDLIEKLVPPLLDLHAATWATDSKFVIREDAKRFENWEKNYANHLGMGVAIDLALEIGVERIWHQIQLQAERLRDRLSQIARVRVTDLGTVRGGIVTFDKEGVAPNVIVNELHDRSINTLTSSFNSTRFDMKARNLTQLVRASVHCFTTDDEIEQLCQSVEEITAIPHSAELSSARSQPRS
jgi:cysteine desulfurase/selenocysteine lyase